jgi:C-terminal processing protease CtpA/Prc
MIMAGSRGEKPYRGRVMMLIDEKSCGTAEIVAAAIRDSGAAMLVGGRTAGAVLAAELLPISGDWKLQLPVADFCTARGLRLEGAGVTPDERVRETDPGDQALERAFELLTTSPKRER